MLAACFRTSSEDTQQRFGQWTVLVACLVLVAAVTRVDAASSVTLQWDPPTDGATTGYMIWYGAVRYTSWADVGMVLTYRVDGLADNTTYCFAVQAYGASGETSDFSRPVCTTTGGVAPKLGSEIVQYASAATNIRGNWTKTARAGAAGGMSMRSADRGWSTPKTALAAPNHSFDLRFDAIANTPYRIWVRMRAGGNSKWNDSVWVQFSDALVNGDPAYRIGTSKALLVNLEDCSRCGVSGWGWVNSAYWLRQRTAITFSKSGPKTIRIQTREDGVEIDQVVLSASRFFAMAPGLTENDATIVPKVTGTPYGTEPKALPGTIQAAYFDYGGPGVAYADSTAGNTGEVFRQTDVDLLAATSGGHFIAWTTVGEWVTYTVNVTAAGKYNLHVKASSIGGGSVAVGFGLPTGVSKTITIPDTGSRQTIRTVVVPITLKAGKQIVTVRFLSGKVNLRSLVVQLP
jgi:hypothetical protein